jgi:phage gp16-like protein
MKDQYYKRDIAKIKIAQKELQIDDDTYRQMLNNVTGKTSSTKLTIAERGNVLDQMRKLGMHFKKSKTKVAKSYPGKPHNMNAQREKIEALLADMKLKWSYADALAKRMFKVERVAWLKKKEQLSAVIAALSKEQEKRNLYKNVTESLKQLNKLESEIDQLMRDEDSNWRRSIKHLNAINNHLNHLLVGG